MQKEDDFLRRLRMKLLHLTSAEEFLLTIIRKLEEPVLVFKEGYEILFGSEELEKRLGYTSRQIERGTRSGEIERLAEVCENHRERRIHEFTLYDLVIETIDEYEANTDAHVHLGNGKIAAYVRLPKLVKYDPNTWRGRVRRWWKGTGKEKHYVVERFLDKRSKLYRELDELYVSLKVPTVADLKKTEEISHDVMALFKRMAAKAGSLVLLNPSPTVEAELREYDALVGKAIQRTKEEQMVLKLHPAANPE